MSTMASSPMVAALPLIEWTRRKIASQSGPPGGSCSSRTNSPLSSSSASRASARKSGRYFCGPSAIYSPSTFFTTASTSSPRKGLTMKSVAPASIASITKDSCPRAEHMITTAPGSCWTISRVASMPDLYGITMSIVTRSGLRSRKRLTAWTPSSASPATANPAVVKMSRSVLRMKSASSTISTRLWGIGLRLHQVVDGPLQLFRVDQLRRALGRIHLRARGTRRLAQLPCFGRDFLDARDLRHVQSDVTLRPLQHHHPAFRPRRPRLQPEQRTQIDQHGHPTLVAHHPEQCRRGARHSREKAHLRHPAHRRERERVSVASVQADDGAHGFTPA